MGGHSEGGPAVGPRCSTPYVVVSTHPDRGHYSTAAFDEDVSAVQRAYDDMVSGPDLPNTLVLDPATRPFEFGGYLDIWQSKCRITSTGGTTIQPAEGYAGPLVYSHLRDETELGEDGVISNVVIDNLWINGEDRAVGLKLNDLQLSTIGPLHVRSTDGPGLWLADGCIENLFTSIVLSDQCGNMEEPALLIEPESEERPTYTDQVGNLTVNSTQFTGLMIHFPTNDALRTSAGPAPVSKSRRHRKIQLNGCYFHGQGGQTKPLVTLGDAYEISIMGTQMLRGRDTIIQLGESDARWPTGITAISHCFFTGSPEPPLSTGIRTEHVETGRPCVAIHGNDFNDRLYHAVDWGGQEGKLASWSANTLDTEGEAHTGTRPENGDISPF